MIGVAAQHKLVTSCEQRLGQVVHVASLFELGEVRSSAGSLKLHQPLSAAIALTDVDIWLLELHWWVVGFKIGRAIGRCDRVGLAAHWRHRWWTWPNVWKAELSWPDSAIYVEGTLMSGPDTNRLMGLLASDELQREVRRPRPAPSSQ